MGEYLGRVGNIFLGNTDGRFLGRRMTRAQGLPSFLSGLYPTPGIPKPRDMAAWAAHVYQLSFGNSPGNSPIKIPGWGNPIANSNGGYGGDFDAVAYLRDNRVVVVVEGSTTTLDWIFNAATELSLSNAQLEAAWQFGMTMTVPSGALVDLTGQSLGAGMLPVVAAALRSRGIAVNSITGFSTPEFREEIEFFLWDKDQSAGDVNANAWIDELLQKAHDYTFDGDAIHLGLGEVFGATHSPGQVLWEDLSTLNGQFGPVLVRDGVRIHAAGLMFEILNLMPSLGYQTDAPGQTFIIDRHGRLTAFKTGEPAPQGIDVGATFGRFQTAQGQAFVNATIPEESAVSGVRTLTDGTTFVDVELESGQRLRLTYVLLDDGRFIALQERFDQNGRFVSKQVYQGGVDGNVTEITGRGADALLAHLDTNPFEYSALFANIGSSLGSFVGGENPLTRVVASSVISTIALNIGEALDAAGDVLGARPLSIEVETEGFFEDFDGELADAFRGAAIGAVSSFLALELGDALGLDGFGRVTHTFQICTTPQTEHWESNAKQSLRH